MKIEVNGLTYREEWREVVGLEDYYHCSSFGRIKSLFRGGKCRRNRDSILKQSSRVEKFQYLNVFYFADGVRTGVMVHREVAKLFCSNPNNHPVVNHLDSNRRNNFYLNLEWTTSQGNAIHGFKFGKRVSQKGSNHGRSVLTENQVIEIRKLDKVGGLTHTELGRMFNISSTAIIKIVTNQRWKHI